jgi:predicted amidophosphoribosyltransferase
MSATPPGTSERLPRNRSVGLHASCPGCRLRFTPDLAAYLPACPVCGEPLKSLAGTDQAVGLRLFSLHDMHPPDDTHPPPDALALAVSMPDPDH